MSKRSKARHAALLAEMEEKPAVPVITIKRVGWMRYEITSTSYYVSVPKMVATAEVEKLRKSVAHVQQYYPELALDDWKKKRTRPRWPWPVRRSPKGEGGGRRAPGGGDD